VPTYVLTKSGMPAEGDGVAYRERLERYSLVGQENQAAVHAGLSGGDWFRSAASVTAFPQKAESGVPGQLAHRDRRAGPLLPTRNARQASSPVTAQTSPTCRQYEQARQRRIARIMYAIMYFARSR
jgi:hypothetical protein